MVLPPLSSSTSRVIHGFLESPAARPLRFAGTGVAAGTLQLVLLAILTTYGWDALLANLTAFLVAAQFNFLLSNVLTWRDRDPTHSLHRRWMLFHASIALMAVLNMLVFAASRDLVPVIAASVLGIAAGACGNYLTGDRLIFRQSSAASHPSISRRFVA